MQVTFTDDAENEETLTSEATEAVAAAPNRDATGLPTIGGTPQVEQTLTADTSAIDDADGLGNVLYEYQWLAGGSDISGATGSSYLLTSSEQGQTIQVRVTFTDDADNQETLTSEATIAVAAKPNTAPTGLPTISGTPQVEQTLTADTSSITDQDGLTNVSYSYQWIAGGSDIAGATSSRYTLTGSEQGQTIQVRVTFTDERDNAETLTSLATTAVAAAPDRDATGAPTIGGTPQVEQTLTADTSAIADEDGLDDVSYRYQWIAGGSDISGATSSSYTLTSSEQGQTIQVRVTFTDDAANDESLTSEATAEVTAAPAPLTASLPNSRFQSARHNGTDDRPQVIVAFSLPVASFEKTTPSVSLTGATLSSVRRHQEDGLENAWIFFLDPDADGDILFSLLTGQPCDSGGICTEDGGMLSEGMQVPLPGPEEQEKPDNPEPDDPNSPATGAPTIGGTPQVEQTLTADTSPIDDEDGLNNVSYRYQWIAGGTDIDGATGSSYKLTSSEQGQTIKVRVTFTDDADNEETLTSAVTVAVTAKPNTAATGLPTISGTPQVGVRLTAGTADIGDADGLNNVSYSYQWMANNGNSDTDLQDATDSTYTPSVSDLGKTIKVRVSFKDDADNAETLTSQATTAVAPLPNRPAAGAPSMQGVLQDRQVLTADTVGIIDADGLTDATFSYQWMRVTDGDSSEISGQTSSTYTLTTSDLGNNIQLKVAFTDDREHQESLTSAATPPVAASGATWELLWLSTMTPEDPDGLDPDFQFSSSADEGGLSPAAFTDGKDTRAITFLGASFDSDATLSLELDFEPATAQIATWKLALHDTEFAFADAIIIQTDSSPPSYRFQWDVTALAVDGRDLWDDEEAFTVSLLEAINLPATGVPAISGTPQVNETLSAAITGITDGNGLDHVSYEYQWSAGGSDIDGATGSSFTLTSSQEGQTIQVQVSFTDDDGFSETATSVATATVAEAANTPPTGLPAISGTPQVGRTLTADTSAISDQDGLSNVSYDYQWIRNDGTSDTDLQEATASTYTPSVSDVGRTIKVQVSFTDDEGNEETLTSEATAEVLAMAPTGPLRLTVAKGDKIEELDTSWQAPASDGGSAVTGYKVQWKEAADSWDAEADVAEATETGTTHTITDLTGGVEYAVRVIATNDAGDGPASTEAKGTPAGTASERVVEPENSAPTGLPGISGTPQVDQALTASTSDIDDVDGLTNVSYRYQWIAGGSDIDGATGSTYTLTASEQGQTIQVRVTFTDDRNNAEILTSAATVAVAAKANTVATGLPAISGTPQVGETLTASTSAIADRDGLNNVSYRYQWIAGGTDIDGATGSSYKLTSSEQGQTIKVRVTFTDDADNQESLTSVATGTVDAKPNTGPMGLPTISGTPQVEETLTADTSGISDGDGLENVSYSYQWIAGGTDISGATGSRLALTASQQGQTIQVRVTFTDNRNNSESLTSVATDAVAAKPVPLTAAFSNVPSSHSGSGEFTFDFTSARISR